MIQLDGSNLTIEQLRDIARNKEKVEFSPKGIENIEKCRAIITDMVESGMAIYGVTTGIGEFARIRVSPEQSAELQRRIIYSHAAGTGDPQPIDVVRGAMVCRANTLAKGYSGVRLKLANIFLELLNKEVTPFVFEKGSVGTSGDLSPMAQLAEVCLGEGEAYYQGQRMPGGEALKRAGIQPVDLSYKEGLGLINGSQMTAAGASLLLIDARNLLKNAFIAAAMTIDALKGVLKAYDARYHAVRPFKGQNAVAHNLRTLMAGSEIIAEKSSKVQDGYSMRCTPQVLGPSVDTWFYMREQIETEINSAADNPLFFPADKDYIAGGNFHGQVIGMVTDFLCIAMSEVANLSERHTNRLLNPVLSGLPDFLVEGRGLNSGLMVSQYTAAALVSENKVLSHPSTVDSISVSADQEDHVAMTPVAVRKCTEILKNVGAVLAIEMMCAAQAFDFRKPLRPGKGTAVAYDLIRKYVTHLEVDRVLYPDINKIAELVRSGEIVKAVEKEIGELPLRL
ncbi:MAG: histidine ammonia-lyase [candidate division Zixibacteria bacterium CG_4_9_14_3_um_filter_46_8]|nr:MAG: histidine ammonia-lyase [candidate division Zixibacteria bacterium CG_4_9_14_3_um_filter_46_8]